MADKIDEWLERESVLTRGLFGLPLSSPEGREMINLASPEWIPNGLRAQNLHALVVLLERSNLFCGGQSARESGYVRFCRGREG